MKKKLIETLTKLNAPMYSKEIKELLNKAEILDFLKNTILQNNTRLDYESKENFGHISYLMIFNKEEDNKITKWLSEVE